MLFKKLWRTIGLYKAQFISMIVMTVLGIGIFTGFNMEWVSIETNTSVFFKNTAFADYRIVSETGFSKDDVKTVNDISGVDEASRYLSVNTDVKGFSGDSLALTVTENEKVSLFVLIDGEKYDAKSEDGIWLSDKYAAANDIELGDTLTLEYAAYKFEGKVKGLVKSGEHLICVRDESQLMPDYSTHSFAYISPAFYEKVTGFDYYPQINAISDMSKKDFTKSVDDALNSTPIILTKDETISYSEAMGESKEGKTMGSVLPVIFLLISVLTMVTTMHRLAAQEKTQIGTLKALGFKDRRIIIHYSSYAFMIAVIGSVFGIALGYGLAYIIMSPNGMMGTYLDMPNWELRLPLFCTVTVIAIILFMTLIGFCSVKAMLKGNAADALRPYTPKKVKPMLIERTKLFHKLPFGTRWNMRDTVRHKSRTAMSLIGTIGCVLLIIASFGMKDTMASFITLFYEDANRYETKIYIADNTSQADAEKLVEKYKGDWSSTISVQLDEKAVSLDIYNISNNLISFLNEDNALIDLDDSGALVCKRIADRYNLSAGDRITVSPYGSDKKYDIKISGVCRSLTESIILSEKYANELNIEHSINAVYTAEAKESIESSDFIKTVQSKSMIMDSFVSFMKIMDTMIYLLVFGAMLLGTVVLYNLGVMSYTERYREMATLKVVGFKDRKIGSLLTGQNLWLSIIGIILGVPVGVLTLKYLMKALAGEYEVSAVIRPASYIISILLTLGVSLLVSLLVARKNKNIDMVEALKFAE